MRPRAVGGVAPGARLPQQAAALDREKRQAAVPVGAVGVAPGEHQRVAVHERHLVAEGIEREPARQSPGNGPTGSGGVSAKGSVCVQAPAATRVPASSARASAARALRRMGQRMLEDDVVEHGATADQVLLDDSLEHRWIASAVPRALRVDHGDRPLLADAQAVGLGAVDAALLREAELPEAPLEVVPGREPALLLAALGGGLVAAEEDVPPDAGIPTAAIRIVERLWGAVVAGRPSPGRAAAAVDASIASRSARSSAVSWSTARLSSVTSLRSRVTSSRSRFTLVPATIHTSRAMRSRVPQPSVAGRAPILRQDGHVPVMRSRSKNETSLPHCGHLVMGPPEPRGVSRWSR